MRDWMLLLGGSVIGYGLGYLTWVIAQKRNREL